MLYESLLLLGVMAIGFLAPLITLGMVFRIVVPGGIELVHLVTLFGIYFVWLWQRNGQTLAMQTWQLQLVDARSGQPPRLGQCVLRYLLAWPGLLLTLCGPGLLWALFMDRDRQFLHDRLSGTCIVFNPQKRQEI